jgi:HK97 family phage major capsid protein
MQDADIKKVTDIVNNAVDDVFTKKLEPIIGEISARKAREVVDSLKSERYVFGRDVTGLSDKAKKDFVAVARAVATKDFLDQAEIKANEALIEEVDARGGYLVSTEVAAAIMRIAASVGTIMSQAMKWNLKTDELAIPNYTGSFLTGAYLGVDVAGTVTGLTFGQAVLIAKKWQLAFVVGNDLLADSSVQLADWLLALAGEALANMIDQQGFVGTGAPFVGVMNYATGAQGTGNVTTTYTLGAGKTKFSNDSTSATPNGFEVILDASAMVGQLEESVLNGAAFYMHRTVWAAVRSQKDTAGNFVLPFGGLPALGGFAPALAMDPTGGPIKPAGELLGFPVYTNRWMPSLPAANAATVSTAFMIFGNFKAAAFGDKGEMRVEQFTSGAFGGKEVALADQRGIVYKHRHAFAIVLPQAFVVAYTPAA